MKSWLVYTIFLIGIWDVFCGEFNINVKNDGSYSLEIDNQTWLNRYGTFISGCYILKCLHFFLSKTSANTFMRAHGFQYDQNSGGLVLQKVLNLQGSDVLGSWKAITFVYSLFNDSQLTMNCNILKYDNLNLVRFIQVNILSNLSVYFLNKECVIIGISQRFKGSSCTKYLPISFIRFSNFQIRKK